MDSATRAEWYERLQGCVVDISTAAFEQLIDVLIKVFLRLPEDDASELLGSRRVLFLLPTTCFARALHIFTPKDQDHHIIWLIVLTMDLFKESEAEFIYTVALPFTHKLALSTIVTFECEAVTHQL